MKSALPPPATASPRDVATYLMGVLRELGFDGVLVGTTAALATGDIDIRSKDTDVVAIGTRSAETLKRGLVATTERDGLEVVEQGWGYKAAAEELAVGGFTAKERRALEVLREKIGLSSGDAKAIERDMTTQPRVA